MVLWQNHAILDALFYMLFFNVKLEFTEKKTQQNKHLLRRILFCKKNAGYNFIPDSAFLKI